MTIIKLKNFHRLVEQESTAEKVKDLKAKTDIEAEILGIEKRISDTDLAMANLQKREKDGTLKKSESFAQQAIELQKKVAEYQKKSVALKKMEDLEK